MSKALNARNLSHIWEGIVRTAVLADPASAAVHYGDEPPYLGLTLQEASVRMGTNAGGVR